MSLHPVVAITGASAGIGRATALRLARDGAAVAICARTADRLDAVVAEIRQAGGRVLAVPADVTTPADMTRFVDATIAEFGRLDVMMCNAGFGLYGELDQVTAEQMQQVMDVNFHGTFHAAHAALPHFRRQGSGHLVVTSSIVGRRGIPFMGPYAATKFAQVGLAECLRAELHGTGIHVSVVYPISTETEFHSTMSKHSGFATTRAAGPRQSPDVVANAIARAIRKPVPEVYPYRLSKGLAVLATLAPGFCDWLTNRWRREPVRS